MSRRTLRHTPVPWPAAFSNRCAGEGAALRRRFLNAYSPPAHRFSRRTQRALANARASALRQAPRLPRRSRNPRV